MTMNDLILQPVVIMCVLSFIMMVWMYATRLPAIAEAAKKGIEPEKFSHPSSLAGVLPSRVERVADNHNHLYEQPTVFYAISFVIWALGHTDITHIYCAWAYVFIRIAHSVFQATLNVVLIRFFIFVSSWIALAIMIFRESAALF